MCGIVASVQKPSENIISYLIKGLHALEYRGYDSAGLAVINNDKLSHVKVLGRVAKLEDSTKKLVGNIGIGHTRWATHGKPAKNNSHPMVVNTNKGTIAVVHNGIIENYATLKKDLIAKKCKFTSQTDTEVIVHLLALEINNGSSLFKAIQKVVKKLDGAFAIAAIASNENDKIVCARRGSPILLAKGKDGMYLASDAQAFAGITKELIWLESDDCAQITQNDYQVVNSKGKKVIRKIKRIDNINFATVELGGYSHFMEKEIYEQPDAVAATLAPFLDQNFNPNLFGKSAKSTLTKTKSIVLLACGTSYHIALIAAKWFEEIAKIKTSVHLASEFRDKITLDIESSLIIGVSQSGETADVLAAFKELKQYKKLKIKPPIGTLAISNVALSSLVQICDLNFVTSAGPEIGVASTKTFLTQGVALLNLAITVAKLKRTLNKKLENELIHELHNLPYTLQKVFTTKTKIQAWAKAIYKSNHCLFLGRGIHLPIALEGALKLKEISYIHAEGYSAGELKHGPLALVDQNMPVIALAPDNELLSKIETNVNEVSSRKGKLFVVAGNKFNVKGAKVIRISHDGGKYLSPLIYTIPMQLLSYYTARLVGTDIDKPRNLAKSVTVD